MKNILSILLVFVAFIAKGQIQDYVIEASDSLITKGVLQINADKFKSTTQVSSDDTTLVSLDYLTNLLNNAEYADSLAFHSSTGYLVYYRSGVALDSTSMDGRYLTAEVDGSVSNELQNLSLGTTTTTTQPIGISGGAGITLPSATTSLAGLMSAADKTNLGTVVGWGNHAGLYFPFRGNLTVSANDVLEGVYRNYNTGSNQPFDNNGGALISLLSGDTRYKSQIFQYTTGDLYTRGFIWDDGIWSDWKKVYSENNFTAGIHYQAPLTNPVTGTGTTNYLPKWTGLGTLGNSLIYDDGNVNVGTNLVLAKLASKTSLTIADYRDLFGSEQRGEVLFTGRWYNQSSTVGALGSIAAIGRANGYISGGLAFNSSVSGVLTERMRITYDGNVGIGTITPTQALDVNGNIRVRGVGTNTTSTVLGLDSNGDLTTNVSITGGATWKGGWNASTNTPTLSDATGTNGWWYKVTTAGTQNLGSGSITFAVGDDVIHNGTVWQKFSAMISEADPVFVASDVYNWTQQDSINWTTAYEWGDHSVEGYLTAEADGSISNEIQDLSLGATTTTTQPINISSGSGVTLPAATTTTAGLMSSSDKVKIDGSTSGTGSVNYLAKWNGLTSLGNSGIIDDGTDVTINSNRFVDIIRTAEKGTLRIIDNRDLYSTEQRGDLQFYGKWYTGSIGVGLLGSISAIGRSNGYISGGLAFNSSVDGIASERMRITYDGKIGINKTEPQQILDIGGTIRLTPGVSTATYLIGVDANGDITTNTSGLTENWTTAYNDKINSAAFSGTTTKTLTLTQQDGGTVTANFTDLVDDADASATNEGSLTVAAGTATTSVINSNTSGSTPVTVAVSTGLNIAESGNTITLTNSAPDQTVSLTGSGATSVTGTYPNFTVSSTNTTYTGGNGLVLNGNAFDLGLQELTTGTPSLNTHWIPWVNSANNLHYRVGLLDLQNIAGYNAGKLQGYAISATAPTTNQVMQWNGSAWTLQHWRRQQITGHKHRERSILQQ